MIVNITAKPTAATPKPATTITAPTVLLPNLCSLHHKYHDTHHHDTHHHHPHADATTGTHPDQNTIGNSSGPDFGAMNSYDTNTLHSIVKYMSFGLGMELEDKLRVGPTKDNYETNVKDIEQVIRMINSLQNDSYEFTKYFFDMLSLVDPAFESSNGSVQLVKSCLSYARYGHDVVLRAFVILLLHTILSNPKVSQDAKTKMFASSMAISDTNGFANAMEQFKTDFEKRLKHTLPTSMADLYHDQYLERVVPCTDAIVTMIQLTMMMMMPAA
jgi:hypothetical protein